MMFNEKKPLHLWKKQYYSFIATFADYFWFLIIIWETLKTFRIEVI